MDILHIYIEIYRWIYYTYKERKGIHVCLQERETESVIEIQHERV